MPTTTSDYRDPHTCKSCGTDFDYAREGIIVDDADVGPNATGGTAELFRIDIEDHYGNEFLGFEEEDIGAWCHYCSYELQRKRERVL